MQSPSMNKKFRELETSFKKSNLRKKISYSVSNLNIFSERQHSCMKPMSKFSQMLTCSSGNITNETFNLIFDHNGKEITEPVYVADIPLRETVKDVLSGYHGAVNDFSMYICNSNTPLPNDLSSSRFLSGLDVFVRDIRSTARLQHESNLRHRSHIATADARMCFSNPIRRTISNIERNSICRPNFISNLQFIDENDECNLPLKWEISASMDDMVPAASSLCDLNNKLQRKTHVEMRSLQDAKEISVPDCQSYLHIGGEDLRSAPSQESFDEQDFPSIEEDWYSILCERERENLTDSEKAQQEAIWELIQTEISFIRKLRTMIKVFIYNLRSIIHSDWQGLFSEISVEKLFANTEELYQSNFTLWSDYMRPMYEKMKTSGLRMDPSDLKDAFLKFSELFQPYFRYVIEQNSCTEYFKALYKTNDEFRHVIDWCETKSTDRLTFLDLFIQPMQRLTKYKLLLEAILKRSTDDQQIADLSDMVRCVDDFVKAANNALKFQEQMNRLEEIMEKIAIYDGFSAPAELATMIQEKYASRCKLNLMLDIPFHFPGYKRCLIHHGLLKMKDFKEKIDVYCYLLTDMFIILRVRKNADKLKLVRPPIRIDKIDLHPVHDELKACFAIVVTRDYDFPEAGFIFYSHQSKTWIKHIEKTKEEFMTMSKPTMEDYDSYNIGKVLYSFQKSSEKIGHRPLEINSDFYSATPLLRQRGFSDVTNCSLSPKERAYLKRLNDSRLTGSSSRPTTSEDLLSFKCSSTLGKRVSLNSISFTSSHDVSFNSLKREDSLASTSSKRSSSGVSSSSSSLMNALEEA